MQDRKKKRRFVRHLQKEPEVQTTSGLIINLVKRVKEIYRDIPIDKTDIRKYSCKEKVWYYISKISLEFTCKLRNRFGYGVE